MIGLLSFNPNGFFKASLNFIGMDFQHDILCFFFALVVRKLIKFFSDVF